MKAIVLDILVIGCSASATLANGIVHTAEMNYAGFDNKEVLIVDTDHDVTGYTYAAGQFVAPAPVLSASPLVTPIEFKLLFTAAERVAIKAARADHPLIADFYEIIEDPRLTHVDLNLQSTRFALMYLEEQSLITAARRLEILSGVVQ
ncbi:hypothetical protein [Iodobacter fluviatilis]|uniref:Uncharacterized protein n=1 Tax=Iodobacter fluviatilis TaxID=537 RepID=A0A377QA08_9NEIS|nr:hypothetical protein [Iodobacter fluviatilis]TCU88510.1 hypothetical protein EV682_10394 [Iodobacter fluviatilis]STQ91419.1 Uncharacterised protein [Iodobacter fluviatilis]